MAELISCSAKSASAIVRPSKNNPVTLCRRNRILIPFGGPGCVPAGHLMCVTQRPRKYSTNHMLYALIRDGRSFPSQMFVKSGHNFYEIAGAMPIIELFLQNFIPGIFAGTGATGQGKEVGALRNPACCAALYG